MNRSTVVETQGAVEASFRLKRILSEDLKAGESGAFDTGCEMHRNTTAEEGDTTNLQKSGGCQFAFALL